MGSACRVPNWTRVMVSLLELGLGKSVRRSNRLQEAAIWLSSSAVPTINDGRCEHGCRALIARGRMAPTLDGRNAKSRGVVARSQDPEPLSRREEHQMNADEHRFCGPETGIA